VTRIVQKLFEKQAELFAIRPQGGAYFTPTAYTGFVDHIQNFLGRVNGRLLRFPVPAGPVAGVAVFAVVHRTSGQKELGAHRLLPRRSGSSARH
jgi:hypothetical protein